MSGGSAVATAVREAVVDVAAGLRPELAERRAYSDAENPTGDRQLAADVYADERLEDRLLDLDGVGSYASEERQAVSHADDDGDYHVACDPLDGSSNLKSNNGMGTIVGVYDEPLPAPGSALVASGYVLYGPITTLVWAEGGTVTEFLVSEDEVTELQADVSLPSNPLVYGLGGRVPDWPDDVAAFVDSIEADRLKLRYGGAMVADVNQVLTYGGIFGYPMLTDAPSGKLRLQFEGQPIANVIESAGGASSNGEGSLLSTSPGTLHERSPVFVGNESVIERLEDALA